MTTIKSPTVISFLAQKGGSGKTTLAVHTAVCILNDKKGVSIIDTDSQRSAYKWGERRAKQPIVIYADVCQLNSYIKSSKDLGDDFVVIDTQGRNSPDSLQIAKVSTLVIIPCRPTQFDIEAIEATINIVQIAKTKAAFVLNACHRGVKEIQEARQELKKFGYPIAPVNIHNRISFSRSVNNGSSVTEFDPHGKASEEIRSFYKFIKGVLK